MARLRRKDQWCVCMLSLVISRWFVSVAALTLFCLCKREWDTSPLTSQEICQAVPVFPAEINNRGVSHTWICLREGRFSFWSWDMAHVCTKTATRKAIECDRYFPATVRSEFTSQCRGSVCLKEGLHQWPSGKASASSPSSIPLTFACRIVPVTSGPSNMLVYLLDGRICSGSCTCCRTEIEAANLTCYLIQSRRSTATGPTRFGTEPIPPDRVATRVPICKQLTNSSSRQSLLRQWDVPPYWDCRSNLPFQPVTQYKHRVTQAFALTLQRNARGSVAIQCHCFSLYLDSLA